MEDLSLSVIFFYCFDLWQQKDIQDHHWSLKTDDILKCARYIALMLKFQPTGISMLKQHAGDSKGADHSSLWAAFRTDNDT